MNLENLMTFGSLFAGIGGFDLGFERAGMRCLWQVEKDPFCRKVLAKHWPDVKRYEDIYDVKHPESVDLVCGGAPCQGFSIAGKRRGKADDRYLWPEMFRIIQEICPRWVIFENVPGIINMALDTVLSNLENDGYTCWTFIVPACSVNAPHRRDRIFIVAHAYSDMCKIKRAHYRNYRKEDQGKNIRSDSMRLGTSEWPNNRVCFEEGSNDGISDGVDRLRSLGNAVVPQIAEIIGKMIMRFENEF